MGIPSLLRCAGQPPVWFNLWCAVAAAPDHAQQTNIAHSTRRDMETKSSSSFEEHFPYESMHEDFQFSTLECNGIQFNVVGNHPSDGSVTPDLELAAYISQRADCLGADPDASILHLSCTGHSLAGTAALKLGFRDVAFVGRSSSSMRRTTWRNMYLNCPEGMAMARCFSVPDESLATMAGTPREANGAGPYSTVLLAMDVLSPGLWQQLLSALEAHLSERGAALVAVQDACFLQGAAHWGGLPGGRRLGHTVLRQTAGVTILRISARQQE